jgi:outer membrane protein assembly factor BamA
LVLPLTGCAIKDPVRPQVTERAVIEEISVAGNRGVPTQTLLTVVEMHLNVGDRISGIAVMRALNGLMAHDMIERAYVTETTGRNNGKHLTFVVTEEP